MFRLRVGAIAVARCSDFVERTTGIAFAKNMPHARAAKPRVRERLMVLYEISPRHAYRIISHAL